MGLLVYSVFWGKPQYWERSTGCNGPSMYTNFRGKPQHWER